MPDDTVVAITGGGEGGGGGQHVIQKITERAEVVTPWQQGKRFSLAAFVIYLGLTGALLVLGKALFYIAGVVGCTAMTVWGGRRTRHPLAAFLLWTALMTAMFLTGPHLLDMVWPTRLDLAHPMIEWGLKLWALGFIAVVVVLPMVFVAYRYASETVDPTGPTAPRTASSWPGTIWPWQVGRIFRAANPPKEPEKVIVEVPVPYPVPVQAKANSNMVHGAAKRLPERRSPPPPKMWRARSGNLVQFKDLLRFAELAPECGATFRPWQDKGWAFEYWQDVVDIWAVYGATNARDREAKETTRFLLSTEEAMRRLLESA